MINYFYFVVYLNILFSLHNVNDYKFILHTFLASKENLFKKTLDSLSKKTLDSLSKKALNNIPKETLDNSDEFFHWLSGFTDAEGNFLITLDRDYIRFRFKIVLHIDDIEVLNLIKFKLNIGSVTTDKNTCSFVVQDFYDIKNVICYIFNNYPLHTNKKLDFRDFYKAVLIKNDNRSLSNIEKENILSIKNNMNRKRTLDKTNNTDLDASIHPYWLIGFIEGEGTFGIKNQSPYFQVAQKNTSIAALKSIENFLIYLSYQNNIPINVTSAINKNTEVISLVVNSIDSLYFCILPFIEKYNMYTRKLIDFRLWKMALLLHKLGYYLLPEGRKLFVDISNIINRRYSTSSNTNIDIDDLFKRFQIILTNDSPFNVNSKTHIENVRMFTASKRKLTPNIVYIYDNMQLIEGSPFLTYSAAHKKLGLDPSSKTCNRYIDTNKLYKNRYLFTSTPLEDNLSK